MLVASVTGQAAWRFFEWKRIEREDEPRRVSLEVMLRGTCDRSRLLDLMENFTLFSEHKAGLVKIIGQNHQFLGVNAAFRRLLRMRGMDLDLRSPSSARSQLKLTIEDTLDTGLPRAYDKPLYEQKCSALFEHVYESYSERDAGVYAGAE